MYKIPDNYTYTNGVLKIELFFSYWVFFWFIIYYISNKLFNIKKIPSPLLALFFTFSATFYGFLYLFFNVSNYWIILKYFNMMAISKIIPIYLTIFSVHDYKIEWNRDPKILLIMLLIYFIYLFLVDVNFFDVYNYDGFSVLNDDNKTPVFYILVNIYNYFINYKNTNIV